MKLTDGVWSKSKPAVFYTTRSDGYVDAWDLLQKQNDPILSIKVFYHKPTTMKIFINYVDLISFVFLGI